MPLSDPTETERALARDLYLAFEHRADHFNGHLFRLLHKADNANFLRLAMGFPLEAALYQQWRDAPTETAFYVAYRVGETLRGPEADAFKARFGGSLERRG